MRTWETTIGDAGEKDKRPTETVKPEGSKEAQQKHGSPTEIRLASEELSVAVNLPETDASTYVFLSLSHLILRILDKIGPTMAVLRQDVHRNIERLEKMKLVDPILYSSLGEILKREVDEGTARKRESCSRAILWLTRSMDFGLALLERLERDSEFISLQQIIEDSYNNTLKPWHGWVSSAAYKVALKLIPVKEVFFSLLMGHEQQCINMLKGDIQKLVSLLGPFLDETHALLRKFRLDRLKST
ncbi:hypothetical protein HPP92_004063 [Vanilla planifolia]|uniref:Glycolipid transfer protein domain-containing protein n=1 Tax=Vanilla planifolia TaxID=51239 RepID=A0A835S1T3_VANPL|nr:hypothetical protein HPP92_004475 [Vanilla planifolia]KAG0499790.1 hypothetical protein HPP92_004481 [Vanilla planifolia]KAG0503991.1 hypothetical protein HPP92_004063 [Vanilla planifolia]